MNKTTEYNRIYFNFGRDACLNTAARAHYGALNLLKRIFRRRMNYLLDVGCGTGAFSVSFLDISERVIGLDISKYAIKTARKRYGALKGLTFVQHDIEKTPLLFKNNSFDSIVCSHVLEHVSFTSLPFVLKELNRVLDNEGILAIIVPNCGVSYRKFLFRDKNFGQNDLTHKNFFTTDSLKKLLEDFFVIEKIFTYPVPGLWLLSQQLAKMFSFRFGSNIYVVCKKFTK